MGPTTEGNKYSRNWKLWAFIPIYPHDLAMIFTSQFLAIQYDFSTFNFIAISVSKLLKYDLKLQ